MDSYASPEDAVRADPSIPAQYMRVVAVDHAPSGTHAVAFIEYNKPPHVEPYVMLCERTAGGWSECGGGSGGGVSWISTNDDGSLGVETTWEPRTTWWDVPES